MDALHLQKVNVLNSDPLGARSVFVKSSKREFVTPQRALTSTESNHRTNIMTFIPFAEAFENPVFELIGHFNENEVHELWHRNGIFDARMRAYRSHSRRYSEMITKFFPRIVARRPLTESDIRALVDLQLRSEFDIIAIPDPSVNGSMKQFERNLDVFTEYVRKVGSEPMPYVDMSNDNDIFRKKITRVSVTSDVKCLGLVFRSHSQFYPNFVAISEIAERDLWIHASNVPRMLSKSIPLAQAHLPQAYSIDSLALESAKVAAPLKVKPLARIRKFVHTTLGQTRLDDIKERREEDSACACEACQELQKKGDLNSEDPRKVDMSFKVHETFSSTREFTNSRDSIRNSDFKTYVKSRKYLNLSLPASTA